MTNSVKLPRNTSRRAARSPLRIASMRSKNFRDKAKAMTHWAKRAKNKRLLQDAIEIKMEAERRGGRLLIEMAERGERDTGKGGNRRSRLHGVTVKLSDLGLTKIESSRWQSLARLPADKWESKKNTTKGVAVASLEGYTEIVKVAKEQARTTPTGGA